jgi:hypothetical protein
MFTDNRIDITELGIVVVLQALCNNTKPLGMGKLNPKSGGQITLEDCQEVLDDAEDQGFDGPTIRFDYLFGRPIKSTFTKENGRLYLENPRLYDRDSSIPAAKIISSLRLTR